MATNVEYGLTTAEVQAAHTQYGKNTLELHRASVWDVLKRQLNNPLLLILAVTTLVAYFYDDKINAGIIFGIMTLGVSLGFLNEYSSEKTVSDLLKTISLSAMVIRNGVKQDVPVEEVTVGDVVLLHQGAVVAADMRIVQAQDLTINESSLTGESAPVHKKGSSDDTKACRGFMGTVVISGTGIGIVEAVGKHTEFGHLSSTVTEVKEKTAFQKGLTQLGSLITKVILVMAVVICFLNIGLGRSPVEAILFSLAIAIGLTPALLPVIVTVCMARGAHRMAKLGVVVKELVSIEDLGNMDVLCTDKTGTLTEGRIDVVDYYNSQGKEDAHVLQMALIANTARVHHRIIGHPIDVALWEFARVQKIEADARYKKVFEEEFDYEHRFQFAVAEHKQHGQVLVVKGAPDNVLERCRTYRDATGQLVPMSGARKDFKQKVHELNQQGLRLVAVAQRSVKKEDEYTFEDAQDLEFLGYVSFLDVPKPSAQHAIATLQSLGVAVKIVTGDNELVTQAVCQRIGFPADKVLTGPAIAHLTAHELEEAVLTATIFARVSPEQKEAVIRALKKAGKTVGFLGDGINDAAALHAADVSITVNTAVDVAKDVASIVLLHKGLEVIADGVREGRRIFANTIKYILMGTSSNFGNMFSVAGASFILPFLPMTPSQILLNNSLYDFSQLGIPSDNVDDEVLLRPHRWNISYIYRYMLFFGPISSVFDYASFAILWFGFHATASQFQTGWFLESIATQVLVVFVIRTGRVFWRSRPGKQLLIYCGIAMSVAFVLPFTRLGGFLHFTALPFNFFVILLALIALYLAIVEFVKRHFLGKIAESF